MPLPTQMPRTRIFRPRLQAAAALVLAWLGMTTAHAQAYVNVTVGGQFAPGVYGQVAIGNNPPPPVIFAQPVVAGPQVYGAPVVYMHVPQDEYRDWGRHCGKYRVCGYPVQFVRVDVSNRWWENHNQYLREPEHYYHRDHERQDERHGHRGNGRNDYYRGDRQH
jgi:hypothetical protein